MIVWAKFPSRVERASILCHHSLAPDTPYLIAFPSEPARQDRKFLEARSGHDILSSKENLSPRPVLMMTTKVAERR